MGYAVYWMTVGACIGVAASCIVVIAAIAWWDWRRGIDFDLEDES